MKPKTYKYKGELKTLGEWAKQLGIPYNNLFMRLKQGWAFARAVSQFKVTLRRFELYI